MDNGNLFDLPDVPADPHQQLQLFEFPATGHGIRSFVIEDEPWFVAADVCRALGHTDPSIALRMLDDDERRTLKRSCRSDTPYFSHPMIDQRVQSLAIVTEAGLYTLIVRSSVPGAKAFKRWVTHEVLPAIRKTGAFGVAPRRFDPSDLDHVVQLAQIAADQKRQIAARDEKIAELVPMAAQAEQHRAADGLLTIADLANKLKAWAKREHPGVKVLHSEVWDFAGELGLIIRGNTVRRNRATAFATENDYIREKESVFEDGNGILRASHTPRLTPRGEGWLWDRATARITKTGTLRKIEAGAA